MASLSTPPDGRLTSQNVLSGTLDATSVMPIVSPGNVSQGNSYQVSLATLALFFSNAAYGSPTIITAGASYNSVATDVRILVNKTVGSNTSVILLPSASYTIPILVKDLKGDADTHPITVTFTSGQTIDGLSQVEINNPFGYFWFNPLLTGWYDASY